MKATIQDLIQEQWLRRRDSGEIYWETENGDKIPIKSLSDAYLQSAIEHLVMNKEFIIHSCH